MGLFNQIIGALNNPEQEASPNQLSNILGTIQQLSSNSQANPAMIQSAMSIIGNYTRSSLQEKRNQQGEQTVNNIINQFAGNNPNNQAVNLLFTNPQIENLVTDIEAKTGMNKGTIQSMLPMLVPLVLNILKTGANPNNPANSNSVLNNFLDADGDGDVDIADALNLAGNYLK